MTMADNLRIGVMGCGNISTTYFRLSPLSKGIEITACADLNSEMAEARAQEYSVTAMRPAELLASKNVDLILNLTVPDAHFGVSLAAVKAGKHVYSEKPLVLSMKQGMALKKAADANKARVGWAPDTFLGGAHQSARKALDDGDVGTITSGTAHIMGFGTEHWHPNPDFFFKPGGGSILDMGPLHRKPDQSYSPREACCGPHLHGAEISHDLQPTARRPEGQREDADEYPCVAGVFQWRNHNPGCQLGCIVSSAQQYRALWQGRLALCSGSQFLRRRSSCHQTQRNGTAVALSSWDHPFGIANHDNKGGRVANYRNAGLADMATAIRGKRGMRCSLERALHGVEVMTSILASGGTSKFIDMKTTCTRPKALAPQDARALVK